MPSGWEWVIAAVAVLCLWCVAMWLWHLRRGRRHRPDCACDTCFAGYDAWVQRVREAGARQAAELNQEKQR